MSCSPWHLAVICACVTPFTSGSEALHCNMTATWQDLRGVLRWDCPAHMPHATYTVRKRTQGDEGLEAVRGCVRVMTRSCDISRAFAEFELYNWIVLEQEDGRGSLLRSEEKMFDPLTETVYSPPSPSLSLQGSNLTVSVTATCSPIRACPPRDCCPLSRLINDFCTSIAVYSEAHPFRKQIHRKCGMEEKVSYEFRGLVPGQRYCTVANFTSSPASFPQCVDLPMQTVSELLRPLWFLGAVLFMLFATAPAVYHLRQRCASAETPLPKALKSLQNEESMELWVSSEEFPEDFCGDHISVLSQSPSVDGVPSVLTAPEAQTDPRSQGDGYCSNPSPMDMGLGQVAWDSEGMGEGLEPSDITCLPLCDVVPSLARDVWGLPPQMHAGPGGMVPDPPKLPPPLDNSLGRRGPQEVLLCSVRLGVCEEDEELGGPGWFNL